MHHRRGKTVTVVLLSLCIVAALAGIAWWLLSTPARPSVEQGRATADAFFAALQAGKPGEAWDAAATDFKSFRGKETFVATVKQHPFLKEPMEFVSAQGVTVQGLPREELVYHSLETKAKETLTRLLLVYQDGAWKVDQLVLPE